MLEATESYEVRDARYDGRVGAALPVPRRFSVSALEALGKCPLQYFFRHGLRVGEVDEETDPFGIAVRDVGISIHGLLERVYSTLVEERRFESGRRNGAVERALELIDALWDEEMRRSHGGLDRRFPVLWDCLRASWMNALRRFVRDDLGRQEAEGWAPVSFERRVEREIDFGRSVRAAVVGRFDRTLAGGDRTRVGDYKTSGDLKNRCDGTKMLKAVTLQVPLYRLLAGGEATVELLGVGPYYEDGVATKTFEGFDVDEQASGFLETVRILLRLRERGRFPVDPDDHRCGYCPYGEACRHTHPPTVEREENAADTHPFRRLREKSKTKLPLLGPEEEDGPDGPPCPEGGG
jgi:RecB family exonuclease